jgi:serine/threonine protein kinase
VQVDLQTDSIAHIKASIHQQSNGQLQLSHMRLFSHSDIELANHHCIRDLGIGDRSSVRLVVDAAASTSAAETLAGPTQIEQRWLISTDDIEQGRRIGSGALGIVMEAMWQQGTRVAIKKLYFLDSQSLAALGIAWSSEELAQVVDKFMRECRTNAHIRHPNIVQFLGVGVDNIATTREPRLMVMEYMSGGSLSDLLYGRDGRLTAPSLNRQLSILIDVCCALQYLHSLQPPILHLDIKPDNILLDATTGRAKLGDLGESHVLAHHIQGNTIRTLTPFGSGTPLYMAPEMRLHDEHKSGRTDMFSFGVVMCEMSSGTRPNPGPEMQRVDRYNMRVVAEPQRRAQDIRAMRNNDLRLIVGNLIVDDMPRRWSAKQVLQQLMQLTQHHPPSTVE